MNDDKESRQLREELAHLRGKLATLEARLAQRQYGEEASLSRAILDAIPDPAWLKDKAGRFLAVNAAWCRFFGVDPNEVLGKTAFEYLPHEIAETLQEQDRDILRFGRPLHLGESLSDKNGRLVWFETVKSPVCNDRGEVIGTAGIARDITASKQLEESLRQSEDRYRSLFNGMTEGFGLHEILCDEKGEPCDYRFLDLNPGFEHLTGLKRSDVIGKTMREVLPDEDLNWIETYGKVALTGQPIRFDSYSTALGRHFEVFAYRPAPRQFAVLFSDVTQRRKAEEERRRLESQILHAQKLESLGVLAGGIAHDFNNILAGIVGYADLAMSDLPPSAPACADIEEIKKAAQRAADLTRQMLAYSGKGKFVVGPVSLSRSIEDLRRMLEVSVSKRAVLNYDLAPDLPLIQADASQIDQVLMNLVINASEALGDKGGAISISTVTVQYTSTDLAAVGCEGDQREGPCVCLEVADTGCGMNRETLERIFDPFFTTKFPGRGLGLAAVHGIVRGHQGAISVSSEPGKGSTFRVLFPINGSRPAPAPTKSATDRPWRGHGTVLVVDDEEAIRKLSRRMIERIGFSVLTAADAHEAIRVFRERQKEIVCVLLDLNMPQIDGEATFRELQRICPEVRVVLSSGYSEEDAVRKFAGLGLAGFIQKPHRYDTMIARLREIVGEGQDAGLG